MSGALLRVPAPSTPRPLPRAPHGARDLVRSTVRALPAWAAATLGLVALLALDVVRGGPAARLDLAVNAAAAVPRSPAVQQAALVVDDLGLGAVTITVLLALASTVGAHRRTWRPLLLVLGALPCLYAVVWGAKVLIGRGRAVDQVVGAFEGGRAFPSGHAANTAFAAVVVMHLVQVWTGRRLRPATVVLGFAVPVAVTDGVSLFLGFHWLSDLVAGNLVGATVAGAAVRVAVHLGSRAAAVGSGAAAVVVAYEAGTPSRAPAPTATRKSARGSWSRYGRCTAVRGSTSRHWTGRRCTTAPAAPARNA